MAEQQFTQEDLSQDNQSLDQIPMEGPEPKITEPVIPMADFGKELTTSEKTFGELISSPIGRLNEKLSLSDPSLIFQQKQEVDGVYQDYQNSVAQKEEELQQKVANKEITNKQYQRESAAFNTEMQNYVKQKTDETEQYYKGLQDSQPEIETRVKRLTAATEKMANENEAEKLLNEINSYNNMVYAATAQNNIQFQDVRQEDQGAATKEGAITYRQPKELAGTQEGIEIVEDTSPVKLEVDGIKITENEYNKRAQLTKDKGIFTIPAYLKAVEDGTLPPDAILETGIYYPDKMTQNLDNGQIVTSYTSAYEGQNGAPVYVMLDYDPITGLYKQRFVEKGEAGMEGGGKPKQLPEIVIDPFMDKLKNKDPQALAKVQEATEQIMSSNEYSYAVKLMALTSAFPDPNEFKIASDKYLGKRVIEQIAPIGTVTPSQLLALGSDLVNSLQKMITGRKDANLTPGKLSLDILKDKRLAVEIDRLAKDSKYQSLMRTPYGMSQLIGIAKTNISNKDNLEYINQFSPILSEMTSTFNRSLSYLNDGVKTINSEILMKKAEVQKIMNRSGFGAKTKIADNLLKNIEFNSDPNYRNVYKALVITQKINANSTVTAEETEFMRTVGDNILRDKQDLQKAVIDDYNAYKQARIEAINSYPDRELAEYVSTNGPEIERKSEQIKQFQKSIVDSPAFENYGNLMGRLSQAADNLDAQSYENISGYFPYLQEDPQTAEFASVIPMVSPTSAMLNGIKSLLGNASKTFNFIEGRIGYDEMIGNMESSLRDNKQFLETYRQKTGNLFSDVAYQTFEMLPMVASFSATSIMGAGRPFLYSIAIGDNIKQAAEAGLNTTAERMIYSVLVVEGEYLLEKLIPETVYAKRGTKPSLTADLFKKILTPSTRKAAIRQYAKTVLKTGKKYSALGIGEYAEEVLAEKLTLAVQRLSNDYLNSTFTPTEWTGRDNIEMMLSMLASTTVMGGTRKMLEKVSPTTVDGVNISKAAKALRSVNYLDEKGQKTKLDKNESLLLASLSTPTGLYEMTKFINEVESGNISKYDLDTEMYRKLEEVFIPAAMGTSIFKDKSLSIEQRAAYIAAHGRRIEIEKGVETGEITGDVAKFQIEQIESDKQKILKDSEFAKSQFDLTGEDIKDLLYDYFQVSDDVIKSKEKAAETKEEEKGPIVTPFTPTETAPAAPDAKADIERRRQEELKSEEYRTVIKTEDYTGSLGDNAATIRVTTFKDGSKSITLLDENGVKIEVLDTLKGDRLSVGLDKFIDNPKLVKNSVKEYKDSDNKIVNKINAKYDAELNNLEQQLKTQQDATQISERQQQEIPQPSNIVQREGTQEGQPQVGQAEGGIGQTTQQAADTGNRPISSQAQEEIKKPTLEEQVRDMQAGNIVSFTYDNESQVPEVFKDKISSRGETNGKPFVRVSVAKVLADYELGRAQMAQAPAPAVSSQEALKDVESTNKALEGIDKTDLEFISRKENNRRKSSFYEKAKGILFKGFGGNASIIADKFGSKYKYFTDNPDYAKSFSLEKQYLTQKGKVEKYETNYKKEFNTTENDYNNEVLRHSGKKSINDLTSKDFDNFNDKLKSEGYDVVNIKRVEPLIPSESYRGYSADIRNVEVEEHLILNDKAIKKIADQPSLLENNAKSISESYHKAKADGSNPELVSAVENLLGQQAPAPAMGIAPVEDIMTLDTKDETNLQKVFNFLDNIDKQLDKFGRETAGINLALPVVRAIVKAVKALVQGGMTLQDAIKRAAADNNVSEQDVMDSLKSAETASRVYSNEQVQGVITIANEAAANIKKTEKSSLKAYQQVFSTVQKAVQNLYDTGIVPDFASARVMAEVTQSIARDAVNAAYTSTKKISAQEVESVTMSTRKYIADLMARQAKGVSQAFDKAKAVRKAVTDVFKAKNKQYGNKIQLSISDFNSLLKQMEDSVFRAPLTEEAINDAAAKATSIIEDAYNKKMNADMAAFEKQARPKIKELVDRFIQSEARKFDSVDAAAYSAFSKAMAYMEENKKDFGIKANEGDNVLSQEMDRAINELKQQKRDVAAAENVNQIFATPQGRQIADMAEAKAQEIVKENKKKKIGKVTAQQAYKSIVTDLVKSINAMYARGNYPAGISSLTMVKAAYGVAQDAVNAVFPRSEKISPQEAQMVNMSMREYMANLVSSQISGIGQLFNNSKKMTSALKDMFKSMNETFGRGMELRTSEVSKIISEIQSVVFDKSPDLQTSMEEATRQISAIVDKGYRRKMIDEMATAIDKINARLKTKYSGDLIPKIGNIVSISPSDWDKSNATLEDINLFNTHLKQIAKGDNTKIDPALDVLNSVTITDQQKTKSEFDKLNTKLTNLNNKVKAGTIDIAGLKDLIRLQKAINNIAERKGVEGAMSESQQAEIQKKFDELEKRLPKPIEQLVQDKVSEVKDNVNSRVAQMKNELIDPASGLGQKIKSNDLHYQFVRMVNNYLTDDYINNLAETNPSKLVSLLSALDDIYNDGNYNNDSYLEYVSAIKYKFQKAFSEWSDNLSKNRSKFASNGVVNAFKEVARTLTDVEGGNVSPEAIKNNLATLRIHQYDVELTGKRDEFDMGILERDLFGPMAMHQDAAMNKTQPVIEKLRDAMILYADKSNHPVIKRAINAFGSRYGVEIDVMFGKLKQLTKRGYQTRLLHDVSVRMASIINNQIDDISNLAEGDVEIDIILQRSIIGVNTDDKGRPIYSDKTMAQYYSKPGTLKLDVEQNYNKLVNAIAYAALTNNGTTTLVGLKEQELLDLLTPKQKEGIAAWREVINQTESLTEAAMVITGNMNPLLKNYFPRRVQQEKNVTEIDDTESYLNGGFEYGGLANNMLKSRRGNVGALDLDGNKVLFNYIKSLNLLVEVKPFLDYVKGLKDAQQKAEAEGDLFAARYLKGIELFATEKLNAKLLQNEKSLNETFSAVFKNIAGVQSYTAKSYLISVVRQLALEYPINVAKAGIAIAFANRSFPKQIWRLLSTNKLSLKTSKGKFEWSDYMKVVQFTGSPIARTMNLYADNYVYEYSKSPEQLQREQKLMGWQDTRPKKFLWMNRFENAFKRITGEDFDHKAFEDERGMYRNMYLTAVEKASFLADATVDKQYGSSSFTRDPLRVNIGTLPVMGILTGTLIGGPAGTVTAVTTGAAGGFFSRGVRNLLNRIFKTDRALFTIKKDHEAALVTGFLQGYPSVQNKSFISDMKRAMSLNSGESFKKRAEIFSRGILESLLPSVTYVVTRTYTGLIFVTATGVILGIGDDEDKEEVKKNALQPNWWERQLYKTRKRFKQQKERLINDLAAGTTSVVLDPQSAFFIKMAGGLAMFKLWKEDAIEKMGEKGVKKDQINEMKKNIKNIENIWFDIYNIRPIDIIHGEAYEKALDRYYSASEPTKDWEETAMTIISYQEIIQTIQFAKTWEELRKNAVENKDIDKDELYSAAVLKAYSILFTLNVLGGKYGYLLSMLTGDARKVSNTMLKDLETQQLEYEIKNKSRSNKKSAKGSKRPGVPGKGKGRAGIPNR